MVRVGQLYFAYGCNMDSEHLSSLVGMPLLPGWAAVVEGWRLIFNKREADGSVVANIERAAGCRTMGVVYRLPREALPALDEYEGYPEEYSREVLWVEPLGRAARQAAFAYLARNEWVGGSGKPEAEYRERLLRGARQHALPPAYIEWLRVRAGAGAGTDADDESIDCFTQS